MPCSTTTPSVNSRAQWNIITGNTSGIVSNSQGLQAGENWWGDNSGPNMSNTDSTIGLVSVDHWFTDPDNDGVFEKDNCPATSNPSQQDSDQDGHGNACDSTPYPPTNGTISLPSLNITLIPVTGQAAVLLPCTADVARLQLENGSGVSISQGCGFQAALTSLALASLPAGLPAEDLSFISALELSLIPSTLEPGQIISLSLSIPPEMQNRELILYTWQPHDNGGLGNWQEIPISLIQNQQVIAAIPQAGIYLLTAR